MMNKEGKFIGHSKVQTEYLERVSAGKRFTQQGKTLCCQGTRYPAGMARELGVFPKGISRKDC